MYSILKPLASGIMVRGVYRRGGYLSRTAAKHNASAHGRIRIQTGLVGYVSRCLVSTVEYRKPRAHAPNTPLRLTRNHERNFTVLGPAPLQKCVGDFCCINFGGFCRGFSWGIFLGTFSHKNEEKISGDKIREKIGGPKIKIREKSVLPGTDPNSTPFYSSAPVRYPAFD